MNELPPIPKPIKKIFPDIKKRQAKINFRKDLRKALFDLRASLPASKAQLGDLIVRFVGYIGPAESTALLHPHLSIAGKANRPGKSNCVAALISWAIQQGWCFQKDEIEKEEAYAAIEKIKQITSAGLSKCEVVGSTKGYELKIREIK